MLSEDLDLNIKEYESTSSVELKIRVFSFKNTFIGFGDDKSNMYAIIIYNNNTIYEVKWNEYNHTTMLLQPNIVVISNIVNEIDNYRYVTLKRSLKGLTEDYYTFSIDNKEIPISYASSLESNDNSNYHDTTLALYETIDYDMLLKINNENYEKWNNSKCNCNSYTYYIQRSCFCDPCFTSITIVEVNNTQVIGANYTSPSVTRLCQNKINLNKYYSIEQIFAKIDSSIRREPDLIKINYDENCGYPVEVNEDISFKIADDEMYYKISGLKCLD